jgi:hypothetical protein
MYEHVDSRAREASPYPVSHGMSVESRTWPAWLGLMTRRTKTSTGMGPDEIGTPRQAYWSSLDAHHDHSSFAP